MRPLLSIVAGLALFGLAACGSKAPNSSPAPHLSGRVLLMGASLTSAVRVPPVCGQPMTNDGIGGATVATYLPRASALLVSSRPAVTVISLSVNDTAGHDLGQGVIDRFATNYAALVDQVRAAGSFPVLMTITPVEKRLAGKFDMAAEAKMNDAIRKIAAQRDTILIDVHAGFVGSDGYMIAGWTKDGVHIANGRFISWLQKAAKAGLQHLGLCQ